MNSWCSTWGRTSGGPRGRPNPVHSQGTRLLGRQGSRLLWGVPREGQGLLRPGLGLAPLTSPHAPAPSSAPAKGSDEKKHPLSGGSRLPSGGWGGSRALLPGGWSGAGGGAPPARALVGMCDFSFYPSSLRGRMQTPNSRTVLGSPVGCSRWDSEWGWGWGTLPSN